MGRSTHDWFVTLILFKPGTIHAVAHGEFTPVDRNYNVSRD